jgi:Cu/Ag efflux protein CusF
VGHVQGDRRRLLPMMGARVFYATTWVLAVWGAACHARPEPAARRYALHGTILAVDRGGARLVVQHDSIPGFMSAMTMSYPVGSAQDLDVLENGDEIRADVVVGGDGRAHLEHITVVKRAKVSQLSRSTTCPRCCSS